jgi:transcriptional regulator with XRE-family HTH domain
MSLQLDTEKLATMVKSKRAGRGLRIVAKEIGDVSASTLSRIEQGSIPDVNTFLMLCKWLGVSTDTFIISGEVTQSSTITSAEKIVAHLRADRVLPQSTKAPPNIINCAPCLLSSNLNVASLLMRSEQQNYYVVNWAFKLMTHSVLSVYANTYASRFLCQNKFVSFLQKILLY